MSVRPTYEGERTALDADGTLIREFDGVRLLRTLVPTGEGNCETMPSEIPAGTRATAIMLIDAEAGLFELECYLEGEFYAFAQDTGENLRVEERVEDKKAVEI